jgi:hypothetical protein
MRHASRPWTCGCGARAVRSSVARASYSSNQKSLPAECASACALARCRGCRALARLRDSARGTRSAAERSGASTAVGWGGVWLTARRFAPHRSLVPRCSLPVVAPNRAAAVRWRCGQVWLVRAREAFSSSRVVSRTRTASRSLPNARESTVERISTTTIAVLFGQVATVRFERILLLARATIGPHRHHTETATPLPNRLACCSRLAGVFERPTAARMARRNSKDVSRCSPLARSEDSLRSSSCRSLV